MKLLIGKCTKRRRFFLTTPFGRRVDYNKYQMMRINTTFITFFFLFIQITIDAFTCLLLMYNEIIPSLYMFGRETLCS